MLSKTDAITHGPLCAALLETKTFHGLEVIYCYACPYIATRPAGSHRLARLGRAKSRARSADKAPVLAGGRAPADHGSRGHFHGNGGAQ
jgi:hypothetical protein